MFLPSNITLQFGDSGDFVAELQRRLAAIDAHSSDGISGLFDGPTVNSVSSFQSRCGLRADGIAGPETLRRLNGVIAGDTSGSGDKKEEEAKSLADEVARTTFLMENQPPAVEPIVAAREEYKPSIAEPAVAPQPEAAPHYSGPTPEQMQQQLTRDMQMQRDQQYATPPGESLAQMLLQQTAARQESQPEGRPEFGRLGANAAQDALQQRAGAQQTSTHKPGETQTPTAATGAEQTPSVIGRAMQKLDAFVQKLANYFEAKLSPDVLQEVKQLGQVMRQSGVRETPIPTGPEQVQTQATPGRGQDQPQIQQRG